MRAAAWRWLLRGLAVLPLVLGLVVMSDLASYATPPVGGSWQGRVCNPSCDGWTPSPPYFGVGYVHVPTGTYSYGPVSSTGAFSGTPGTITVTSTSDAGAGSAWCTTGFQPCVGLSGSYTNGYKWVDSGGMIVACFDAGCLGLTPPAASCTTQLADTKVALDGTTLSARTKVNSSGWTTLDVLAPDPGVNTGTAAVQLTPAYAVDGAPGYVYRAAAVSGAPGTARLVLKSGSTVVCYLSVTVSSGTIRADGSTSGAADEAGTDCGWNAFCYIKAALRSAFVPSSSTMTSWSARVSDIKTRPPVSFLVSGMTLVGSTAGWLQCGVYPDDAHCTGFGGTHPSSTNNTTAILQAEQGDGEADLIDSAGDMMQDTTGGRAVFAILTIGIAGVWAIACWRRLATALGDRQ